MKDVRLILAYAVILFSIGFVLRSITTANAYPTGPNVSLGSNPSFSFYSQNCSSDETAVTVSSDQVLVITDIISAKEYDSENITLKTSTATLAKFRMDFYTPAYYGGTHNTRSTDQSGTYSHNVVSLRNGIVVPSGETLIIGCSGNMVTVTGYYSQP